MKPARITDLLLRAVSDGTISIHEALSVLAAIGFCADFTEEQAAENGLGSDWVQSLRNLREET